MSRDEKVRHDEVNQGLSSLTHAGAQSDLLCVCSTTPF